MSFDNLTYKPQKCISVAIVVIYGNIQWICVTAADGLTFNDESMLPEIHPASDFNVDSMYSTEKRAPPVGCDIMMTPNGISILGSGNILRSTLKAGSTYLYYIRSELEKVFVQNRYIHGQLMLGM